MIWPWRRTGGAERARSAESRAVAEDEVIGPLRRIREEIATSGVSVDADPDVFARAIEDAIRGGA